MPTGRRKKNVWRLSKLAVVAFLAGALAPAEAETVGVPADADAFTRSFAPTNNYGAAGALSVSGSEAVNGSGVQNGVYTTLLRFTPSNVIVSLDSGLGGHDWIVTKATLLLTEMASPDNAIFNRGVGSFEVIWQAADIWIEGTGKPNTPATDGVTWEDLGLLMNPDLDSSLGFFTNAGANGQQTFSLALTDSFVADLRAGGEVSLRLTAASPEIGFTFNSREFGNTNAQPRIEVTAVANPKPKIEGISLTGIEAIISFSATTNWEYQLQRTEMLDRGSPGGWLTVLTIPPQMSPTNVTFVETRAGGMRFYRLSVSQ